MSRRERNLQDQEFSKKEMKIIGIIGIVCVLLIVLIVVITVINGSDSHTIASDYELANDNVYEYITLDEIKSKQVSGDDFHVIITSSTNNKTKTFVQIANDEAKSLELKKIYLLEIGSFTKSDQTSLTAILDLRYDDIFGSKPTMSIPALIYFEDGYPIENSGLTNHPNQTEQIREYFSNCGYTYED